MTPRFRFIAIVALVLAGLLRLLPVGSLAQTASPVAAELPPIAAAFAAAWSSRDPDQLAAAYAEELVFEEIVLDGPVVEGREAIRAYGAAVYAAFPDFTATPVSAFVAGDRAAVEWILSGTYSGQFGPLPPGTGQQIAIPVVSIMTLDDDGLILHDREYWDFTTLLAQLGLMPAAATPTP